MNFLICVYLNKIALKGLVRYIALHSEAVEFYLSERLKYQSDQNLAIVASVSDINHHLLNN